jgi:hypothetical protein
MENLHASDMKFFTYPSPIYLVMNLFKKIRRTFYFETLPFNATMITLASQLPFFRAEELILWIYQRVHFTAVVLKAQKPVLAKRQKKPASKK